MEHRTDLLVIGASGMLGQALVRESRKRRMSVTGVGLSETDCCLDICDDSALIEVAERTSPRVLVNAAAITDVNACEKDPGRCYAVNARVVAVLGEWCASRKTHLVQISTDHFFTGDRERKHDENAPVRLVNEYARTKYAAEQFALTCPGALIARTNIVGFRGWPGKPTFLEWALAALQSGASMRLFTDFYTSSIDVVHFAVALFDLVDKRAAGLLNLASAEVSSKKGFIEAISRLFNYSLENAADASVSSIDGARRAESAGLDVGKAERLLGYSLPTLNEVVRALVSEYWERRNALPNGN